MRSKLILTAAFVLFTADVSLAMDNREPGTDKGDFKVELRQRSADDMAKEEDKTQKYILIVGNDEFLDKHYLVQLKSCVESAVEDASNKAEVRNKLLQLFDAVGSPLSSVLDAIQSQACTVFNNERENKKERSIYLTTPNFEGLNKFIDEHLYNCLDSSLNKAHWTPVEGAGGFKIPNSYTLDTIKKYCPKEGS